MTSEDLHLIGALAVVAVFLSEHLSKWVPFLLEYAVILKLSTRWFYHAAVRDDVKTWMYDTLIVNGI